MKIKRIILFLLPVLILTAGNVFAHDKGDLMLNIEPQIGFAFPDIGVKQDGVDWSKTTDDWESKSPTIIGLDFAFRATVHYYFLSFIGINAGIGISGFYDFYSVTGEGWLYDDEDDEWYEEKLTRNLDFAAVYFTIPFGLRFSLSALAVGGGLTVNIPLTSGSAFWVGDSSKNSVKDDDFKVDTYMGWYVDFGFDMSGKKGRAGGFGLLARVSGSLSDRIAKTKTPGFEYKPFRQFAVSLVFQAASELGNYPIGGK